MIRVRPDSVTLSLPAAKVSTSVPPAVDSVIAPVLLTMFSLNPNSRLASTAAEKPVVWKLKLLISGALMSLNIAARSTTSRFALNCTNSTFFRRR